MSMDDSRYLTDEVSGTLDQFGDVVLTIRLNLETSTEVTLDEDACEVLLDLIHRAHT